MTYLNISESGLRQKGALHTAREIQLQPELWKKTAAGFFSSPGIHDFFTDAYRSCSQIILTGAGTSAYIGRSLEGAFFTQTGLISRAIPTTDIVSHPQHFFRDDESPLVISFARSGNSPESLAAVQLADRFSKKCIHLIITCNADGALARYQSSNPVYTFLLPQESNDKSLAMTGSYSSMLLTGLLLAYCGERAFCEEQLALVVSAAEHILKEEIDTISEIASKGFERAVFLGSGPLSGTATEASLKLQELTDGRIICISDSYLGFRHGPKAVIDETTLVVYFFSNNHYVQQYEKDLLPGMKRGNPAMLQLAISEDYIASPEFSARIQFKTGEKNIAEDFLPVCSIVPGQLLGFFKSLHCGLMPDAPSVSGSISRIVEGVNIYPVSQ